MMPSTRTISARALAFCWCMGLTLVATPLLASESTGDAIFSAVERAVIKRYYNQSTATESTATSRGHKKSKGKGKGKGKGKSGQLPPGLAKRSQLPPGLAKRKSLPPGLQRQALPDDLKASLPPPATGTERVLVDGRAVLIEKATNKVLDILEDVIARRQ